MLYSVPYACLFPAYRTPAVLRSVDYARSVCSVLCTRYVPCAHCVPCVRRILVRAVIPMGLLLAVRSKRAVCLLSYASYHALDVFPAYRKPVVLRFVPYACCVPCVPYSRCVTLRTMRFMRSPRRRTPAVLRSVP